jgi:hypothetical protein
VHAAGTAPPRAIYDLIDRTEVGGVLKAGAWVTMRMKKEESKLLLRKQQSGQVKVPSTKEH